MALVEAKEYVTKQILVTGKKLPQFMGVDEKGNKLANENKVSVVMAKDIATNRPLDKGITISWERAKQFNLCKLCVNPHENDNSNGDVIVDMSGLADKLLLNVTLLYIPKNGAYKDKKTGELVAYRNTETYQIIMVEEVQPDKADNAKIMFAKIFGVDYDMTNPDHNTKLLQVMAIL